MLRTDLDIEEIQESLAVKPPQIQTNNSGSSEACEIILKSPVFQDWKRCILSDTTRQYLMTNFLQYAWKNGTTYKDYPFVWWKTPKSENKSKTTVEKPRIRMSQLDKDAPDEIYLAAFCFYNIPIYPFQMKHAKRFVRQPTMKSIAKEATKRTDNLAALNAELAETKAEIAKLRAALAEKELADINANMDNAVKQKPDLVEKVLKSLVEATAAEDVPHAEEERNEQSEEDDTVELRHDEVFGVWVDDETNLYYAVNDPWQAPLGQVQKNKLVAFKKSK
jgi:hypothetical protein